MAYVPADTSLPRSLDVQISLSRPQAETRTALNVLCVACEDLGLLPDANRVRFYSTITAVEADFTAGSDAHNAASAFFSQTPRPSQMAIGEVFLTDQPARLLSPAGFSTTELAAIVNVTDGSFNITYSNDNGATGTVVEFSGLDFSTVYSVFTIAEILSAGSGSSGVTCSEFGVLGGTSSRLAITTDYVGDGVTISIGEGATGTYVGDLLKLTTAGGGSNLPGYTPTGIAGELSNIFNAASNAGKYLYGWCLGESLRDGNQEDAATWALARTVMMPLVTADTNAYDAGSTADIGSIIQATGNRRCPVLYHNNPQRYPDVSILAYMLSVNYQLYDSAVTAKFKQLPGIETVPLTETQWAVLQGKGYNSYTSVGNSARTYRDGTTEEASWFMDTTINLDNFVEDLSVNVFNVFLRNKKVPYTQKGQMLLTDACYDTGLQYTNNGVFADREEIDPTKKGGTKIIPAVQILPTPISQMTAADRAVRAGPPIEMIVQEAGAIHSVAIAIEVVS